jgi:hypothetical protein
MDWRERRAREIQGSIRRVLLEDWDPIGIKDEPLAQDEYDMYVGAIYRLIASRASPMEIANHLARLEGDQLDLAIRADALLQVAEKLHSLDVRLDPERGSA